MTAVNITAIIIAAWIILPFPLGAYLWWVDRKEKDKKRQKVRRGLP